MPDQSQPPAWDFSAHTMVIPCKTFLPASSGTSKDIDREPGSIEGRTRMPASELVEAQGGGMDHVNPSLNC